ncbi:hypothetical protein EAX61_00810 [Dokdonia sinensis]|uniref:Uncharacterized protein n=1 Tax=Dokdonia sinensis TaxID=2479847 RepID=A0A3M0GH07_9FLAO|nr:hypothetical protein [Dokdonia sinensis]RMB63954.1 hypothetical protein EAX61_00810 [Dokdonia sinensis]
MNIKTIISWLPELALRTLRVLLIGFIIVNAWSIYNSYATVDSNPLIPKNLAAYESFPRYVFITFYLVIIWLVWKFLKGDYNPNKWWMPVLAAFVFESMKFYIYGFLMWINPFG